MYHAIVRRRVVSLFAAVSKSNARPVLEGLAPRFEHFFLGDHALGGSRFTLAKTRLWYERLHRLLPDISFDLRAIRIRSPLPAVAKKKSGARDHPRKKAALAALVFEDWNGPTSSQRTVRND
jgi:hypothetical protein